MFWAILSASCKDVIILLLNVCFGYGKATYTHSYNTMRHILNLTLGTLLSTEVRVLLYPGQNNTLMV